MGFSYLCGQLELFLSSGTVCLSIYSLVAAIFGMNIPYTWNEDHGYMFKWVCLCMISHQKKTTTVWPVGLFFFLQGIDFCIYAIEHRWSSSREYSALRLSPQYFPTPGTRVSSGLEVYNNIHKDQFGLRLLTANISWCKPSSDSGTWTTYCTYAIILLSKLLRTIWFIVGSYCNQSLIVFVWKKKLPTIIMLLLACI